MSVTPLDFTLQFIAELRTALKVELTLMALSLKRPVSQALCASTRHASYTLLLPASYRSFSVLNRPAPNYEGHVPLTVAERLGLAVGSGLGSFLDPRRGGMPCSPIAMA
jgi:hypothetical protein